MQFPIIVADGSDELDELQAIVAKANADQADALPEITVTEYVNNIVNGYLTNRVLNEYKGHAVKQNTATLKAAFGSLVNIRKA